MWVYVKFRSSRNFYLGARVCLLKFGWAGLGPTGRVGYPINVWKIHNLVTFFSYRPPYAATLANCHNKHLPVNIIFIVG